MEYNLKKSSLGIMKTCLDTVSEQPIDIDFTLADYCPDIEKILRCKITPKIYSKNTSGGQIQVDGATVVTVLYVDGEKMSLRACEQTVPFSASFQAKDLCENNIIEISTKGEYVNCRALSPRRLAIHGAFSLYVKSVSIDKTDIFSADENADIQCDMTEIEGTELTSLSQNQFTICQEIKITNKPFPQAILTSDVKVICIDYKVVSEKLMLNGELSVKLLYLSDIEKGQLQQLDYVIPFNQVLDCENLKEDAIIRLNLSVMSGDVHIKNDGISETNSITVDAKISATVYGYTNINCKVINDAYSTKITTDINKTDVVFTTDVNVLKDSFMMKDSFSLNDTAISEICDVCWDNCGVNPVIKGEIINLSGKANISVLGYDKDNIPVYIQRSVEINKDIQCNFNFNNVLDVCCDIVSLSYRITEDNSLELRCEVKYILITCAQKKISLVSAVMGNEELPLKKKSCGLTLYYADKGENLWEVAKAYGTKLDLIYEENKIESKILEAPQMLLIPIV